MGCNEPKPKNELLRVVRQPDGGVTADATGRLNGRGAYVCPNAGCIAKVRKTGRAARCLETEIPNDVYDRLLEMAGGTEDGK